jgi:hypothetical protein
VSERAKNLVLTVAAICLAVLGCEMAARLWVGVPVFQFANFRYGRLLDVKSTVTYDPALGWRLRDNLDRPDLHTVEYGVRRNAESQTGIRPNSILVVGASPTQGVEVADAETWPAQLEQQLSEPVDNAAVVGYAIDQMVLRVEQLLRVETPRAVLVGAGSENVLWTASTTVAGAAKLFFTVEDGALRAHNIPVPRESWRHAATEAAKNALGHMLLVDRLMSAVDPHGWHPPLFDRAGATDPLDVSCRLLDRLRQELTARGIQGFLVALPTQPEVIAAEAPADVTGLENCARTNGYRVIDILEQFKKDQGTGAARATDYYVPGMVGHLSTAGNRRVAELVDAALKNEGQLGRLPRALR